MSAWTCRRQGRAKDCSTSFSNPMMEGPSAESVEKREPASDIDAAVVDSLKALDLNGPIREADIAGEGVRGIARRFGVDQSDGRHLQNRF